jgi:hypothetical protein
LAIVRLKELLLYFEKKKTYRVSEFTESVVKTTEFSDKLNTAPEHKKSRLINKSKTFEYEAANVPTEDAEKSFSIKRFLKMVYSAIISKCMSRPV